MNETRRDERCDRHVNETRCSSRSDSRAYCNDETSEKGASGISVSNSVNGFASTSITTSAFHFVTPSNRRVGRSATRDVVSGRRETTPERASHQSGGDATSGATLRRAEAGDAAN